MNFVPHALEWVTALLFRLRTAGEGRKTSRLSKARTTTLNQPAQTPPHPRAGPVSPAMMSAYLTLARLHRAGHAPQNDEGKPHPVVRAYVLPPEQHQHALTARTLIEASR